MDDREQRRTYLKDALDGLNVEMSTASEAIGRNPTYLQQYIKYGTPKYLSEHDRESLIKAYPSIDGAKLKPPIKVFESRTKKGSKVQRAQLPVQGESLNSIKTPNLLDVWDAIPESDLDYALRILADIRDASLLRRSKSERA